VPGHRVSGDRSIHGRKGTVGYQYLFVAIDDASRLGHARLYPDKQLRSSLAFLADCERFYRQHGITIERVPTDNGSCFRRRLAEARAQRGIRAKRTRPRRPQPNGKAERFIRTLLETWAYAYTYKHETDRATAPTPALDSYNRFRRHRALAGHTPLQRVNNLPGTNS
jgi:transposase InsO family protein